MKKFLLVATGMVLGLTASAGKVSALATAPLFFEADSSAQFSARASDCEFSISPVESQIVLQKTSGQTTAVQMQFPNANRFAQIHGENELAGKINYLVGDRAQWRSGVSTFAKVRVSEIYPGIDLIYHGNQKRLEYDFDIAPGANPNAITIRFNSAEKISLNTQGELILKLNGGEIRQPTPEIFQNVAGEKNFIRGGYKILDAHTVSFVVGNYNHSLPLIIDPTLAFSTYFGGTRVETAWSVALGADGSIYVGGQTMSKRFSKKGPKYNPFSTDGAYQETFAGGKLIGDGFLAKFDSTGTNLVYLTYLGSTKDDYISGVAVDAAGDAYVAGFTDWTNFPVKNALFPNIAGTYNKKLKAYLPDAFVAEFDPSGSNLVYSTFLGGSGSDTASAIAIDSSGDVYVTGSTDSSDFPMINSLQFQASPLNHLLGANNAFVSEIGPGGSSLLFSSYLGGQNIDVGEGIAVDASGYIYISGFTSSPNFPATNYIVFTNQLIGVTNQIIGSNVVDGHLLNGLIGSTNLANDAFITKLQPSGTDFVYSTLLGGSGDDLGYRVACDSDGNAYVVGYSSSTNFPNTAANVSGLHSFEATNHNFSIQDKDVFLTKLGPDGTNIIYSALFGGKGDDVGYGIAVDAAGDAFVTGYTKSENFPTNTALIQFAGSTNSILNHISGKRTGKGYPADAFVAEFDPSGSNLVYSIYIGGTGNDYGYGVAVDSTTTNVYVVGSTASKNFPTLNAGQDSRNGKNDSFLIEIQP